MTKAGIRIAQVVAVVFALGASTWIVVSAHKGANPEPKATPTPAVTPGAPGDDEFFEDGAGGSEDPGFLRSSKSFFPSSKGMTVEVDELTGAKDAVDKKKAAKKKPVFLPSSKSMPLTEPEIIEEEAPPAAPAPKAAPSKKDAPKQAATKKKPVYLPTSKSGFVPKEITDEAKKKLEEAAKKAKGK